MVVVVVFVEWALHFQENRDKSPMNPELAVVQFRLVEE